MVWCPHLPGTKNSCRPSFSKPKNACRRTCQLLNACSSESDEHSKAASAIKRTVRCVASLFQHPQLFLQWQVGQNENKNKQSWTAQRASTCWSHICAILVYDEEFRPIFSARVLTWWFITHFSVNGKALLCALPSLLSVVPKQVVLASLYSRFLHDVVCLHDVCACQSVHVCGGQECAARYA